MSTASRRAQDVCRAGCTCMDGDAAGTSWQSVHVKVRESRGGGVLVEVLPMHEQVRPQGQGVHGGDGPTLLGAMRPGGIVSAAWCDAPHTERGCSGWNSGRGGGEGGGARLVRMLAKRARPKIMMTMDTQTSDIEDGVMSP